MIMWLLKVGDTLANFLHANMRRQMKASSWQLLNARGYVVKHRCIDQSIRGVDVVDKDALTTRWTGGSLKLVMANYPRLTC